MIPPYLLEAGVVVVVAVAVGVVLVGTIVVGLAVVVTGAVVDGLVVPDVVGAGVVVVVEGLVLQPVMMRTQDSRIARTIRLTFTIFLLIYDFSNLPDINISNHN
jgi:hypothetical protein